LRATFIAGLTHDTRLDQSKIYRVITENYSLHHGSANIDVIY